MSPSKRAGCSGQTVSRPQGPPARAALQAPHTSAPLSSSEQPPQGQAPPRGCRQSPALVPTPRDSCHLQPPAGNTMERRHGQGGATSAGPQAVSLSCGQSPCVLVTTVRNKGRPPKEGHKDPPNQTSLLPVGSKDLSADRIPLRRLRDPTHQQPASDGRGAPAPKPHRRAPAWPAESTGPGPDSHGLPGGRGDALRSERDSGLGSVMLGFPSEPGSFPPPAGGWGWSGGLLGGTETMSADGHRRQRMQWAQGPGTLKPRANSLSVPNSHHTCLCLVRVRTEKYKVSYS